jgi:CRISPR/Cas system-associated endoribonuclease Cas2
MHSLARFDVRIDPLLVLERTKRLFFVDLRGLVWVQSSVFG